MNAIELCLIFSIDSSAIESFSLSTIELYKGIVCLKLVSVESIIERHKKSISIHIVDNE